MVAKKDTKTKIRAALKKLNFIKEENKKLLLSSLDEIPDGALRMLLSKIDEHNALVEKAIKAAVSANPKLAQDMKKQAQKVKTKIHEMEEQEETGSAEEKLTKELENI